MGKKEKNWIIFKTLTSLYWQLADQDDSLTIDEFRKMIRDALDKGAPVIVTFDNWSVTQDVPNQRSQVRRILGYPRDAKRIEN